MIINTMNEEFLKCILLDIMKQLHDCCSVCENYGQKLTECNCMEDEDCVNHLIELAENKYKSPKRWFKKWQKKVIKVSTIIAERLQKLDLNALANTAWNLNKFSVGYYAPVNTHPFSVSPCHAEFRTKYTHEQMWIKGYQTGINDILQLIKAEKM